MIFKKKKRKQKKIYFYLGDNEVHSCLLVEIPIIESVIIEKSIEFFSDPDPCFIHRSAVVKRVVLETFWIDDNEIDGEWSDPVFIEKLKNRLSITEFDRVVIGN